MGRRPISVPLTCRTIILVSKINLSEENSKIAGRRDLLLVIELKIQRKICIRNGRRQNRRENIVRCVV